jgi:hypothetical protein
MRREASSWRLSRDRERRDVPYDREPSTTSERRQARDEITSRDPDRIVYN